MQPHTLLNPSAVVYEIPESEWTLELDQLRLLEQFRTSNPDWTIAYMKSDSIPFWALINGSVTIEDLSLRTAMRLARESE